MLLQCPFPECDQSIKKNDLAAHQKTCAFRLVSLCPILGFPNCQVVTKTANDFRSHIMENHADVDEEVPVIGWQRWPNIMKDYMDPYSQWVFFFNEKYCLGPACFMAHVKLSFNSINDATFSSMIMYIGDKPEFAGNYVGSLEVSMRCNDEVKCRFTRSGPVLHYKAAEDPDIIPYFSTPIKHFKSFMSPDDEDFDVDLRFWVDVK